MFLLEKETMSSNGATAPVFTDANKIDAILDKADELFPNVDDGVSDNGSAGGGSVTGGGRASRKSQAKPTSKQYYNIVDVNPGSLPSKASKYTGATPSAAAKRAARKIFDQSGDKKFTIVMRKVAKTVAGRTLYVYKMRMVELKDPVAFFTAVARRFENADGHVVKDVAKRIKVVRASADPVYGYLTPEGEAVEADDDESGLGTLHRNPDNNTLVLNIGERRKIPERLGDVRVSITRFDVAFERATPTQDELDRYDVAGKHKRRE